MNLDTKSGITSYLSGFEKNIDELIVPSGVEKNLYILPAGPIPPNPAELLARNTLDKAFEKLREEFDYIIIDSAPASMVTDTLILTRTS
jgi:Mrp family chromosome partitioning ATPase